MQPYTMSSPCAREHDVYVTATLFQKLLTRLMISTENREIGVRRRRSPNPQGDLNNLVPAVGEVNSDRNNFAYSAWTRERSNIYGECQTTVDFKGKRAQPREEVQGRAARITLYMYETYDMRMSAKDKKLMCAWAKAYPVDAWERERDARIVRWQAEGNPLVTDPARLKSVCR